MSVTNRLSNECDHGLPMIVEVIKVKVLGIVTI